jgi:hypothetical protein
LYVFIKKERKGVNFPQKKSQPSLVHALRLTRIICDRPQSDIVGTLALDDFDFYYQ